MSKPALPIKQASFSVKDPRFVEIDGEHYAALMKDCLDGSIYQETLGDFGGFRQAFVSAAEKQKKGHCQSKCTPVFRSGYRRFREPMNLMMFRI